MDTFDPALPWRRAGSVALRPEPFGALVYSFRNRKLSFLKSKTLVTVVETLGEHPSASAALIAGTSLVPAMVTSICRVTTPPC